MSLKKHGIGVVGVGDMGRRHAINLRCLVPEARLMAVADVAEKRAKEVAQELEIECSFRTLKRCSNSKKSMRSSSQARTIFMPRRSRSWQRRARTSCVKSRLLQIWRMPTPRLRRCQGQSAPANRLYATLRPAYQAAMARIEAGEIGESVVFKSIGRDKDVPPISAYQSGVNGMLFYNSTIHDFDLARWMMRYEVREVQAFTTVAIRPEVAEYGDIVAGALAVALAAARSQRDSRTVLVAEESRPETAHSAS